MTPRQPAAHLRHGANSCEAHGASGDKGEGHLCHPLMVKGVFVLSGAKAKSGFKPYCRANEIRSLSLLPSRGGLLGRGAPGLFAPEIAVLLSKALLAPLTPRSVGTGDGGMGLMR